MFSRSYAKTIVYLLPSLGFFGFLFLLNPAVASADAIGNFVTCQGGYLDPCGFCHLLEALNRLMRFVLITMVSIFFILVAFSGFRLATGAGSPEMSKFVGTVIVNGVIGFVIMLAAWFIVDTILKIMMNESDSIGVWNEVTCGSQPPVAGPDMIRFSETSLDEVDYVTTGAAPRDTLPVGTPDPQDTLPTGSTGNELTDSEARARLEAAGIVTKPGVSYAGLQPHVIDRTIALREQCNCDITVTSATDGSHASGQYSHGRGFKLDFRSRDEGTDFRNYIENEFGGGSPDHHWSDGTPVYRNGSTLCAVESDHVDCAFRP